jgi:hypothetical protein
VGAEEDDAVVCCGGLELLGVAFAWWGQLGKLGWAAGRSEEVLAAARVNIIIKRADSEVIA